MIRGRKKSGSFLIFGDPLVPEGHLRKKGQVLPACEPPLKTGKLVKEVFFPGRLRYGNISPLFCQPFVLKASGAWGLRTISFEDWVQQLTAGVKPLEIQVMQTIVVLVFITLIPTLELRASIPFGILKGDMPWWAVVSVCLATNIILGPLVYLCLDKVVFLLLRFERLNRVYQRTVEKTRRRIQKSVDKYGEIGVVFFIGIPLPGTGSYSGALGAYLIGLGYRKFIIANVIGVLIAGAIVTTIVLSGMEAFRILIKAG